MGKIWGGGRPRGPSTLRWTSTMLCNTWCARRRTASDSSLGLPPFLRIHNSKVAKNNEYVTNLSTPSSPYCKTDDGASLYLQCMHDIKTSCLFTYQWYQIPSEPNESTCFRLHLGAPICRIWLRRRGGCHWSTTRSLKAWISHQCHQASPNPWL